MDPLEPISDVQKAPRKKWMQDGQASHIAFFDNEAFRSRQCLARGIDVPIHAVVMPISNRNQALRLLRTCENIHLPRKFKGYLGQV